MKLYTLRDRRGHPLKFNLNDNNVSSKSERPGPEKHNIRQIGELHNFRQSIEASFFKFLCRLLLRKSNDYD